MARKRSTSKKMTPNLRKGLRPPFYQLGEYIFQDLCTDLLRNEPKVERAYVFGKRGQRQYGIDIIAEQDTDVKQVGQCKNYQKFTVKNLTDASDEFFENWDGYWKTRKVVRFILFVACDLTDPKCLEEKDRQKLRFQQIGVIYEVWDARYIQEKLRPHKFIVEMYCQPAEHWVAEICGENVSAMTSPSPDQVQANEVMNSILLKSLTEFASESAEKELSELRSQWQVGAEAEVLQRLNVLTNDSVRWSSISHELKARILCFKASIALEKGEPQETIEKLLAEARTHAVVVNEKRVQALLFVRNGKSVEGLELLHEENDVDTLNLRSALLLDMSNHSAAAEVLADCIARKVATAETFRLMALVQLMQGELAQARINITHARGLEPQWRRMQIAEAIIAYYSSLSPIAVPTKLPSFPLPIDWILVKQDAESIADLNFAEQSISKLLEDQNLSLVDPYLAAWKLASLLNNAERQEEAVLYCRSLLEHNPTYYPAIVWTIARKLDIDLSRSMNILESRLHNAAENIQDVLALANIYEWYGRVVDATHLLERTRHHFSDDYTLAAWAVNYGRLLILQENTEQIETLLSNLPNGEARQLIDELLALHSTGDTTQLPEFIERQITQFQNTSNPGFLLDACMVLYQRREWTELSKYLDTLVKAIRTADVYRLAITGAYNANQFDRCLDFIEQWNEHFRSERDRYEFGQIKIDCLRQSGKFNEAIQEAKRLVEQNPSVTNRLNLIILHYEIGDFDAVAVNAELLKDAELSHSMLLHLSSLLRGHHTALAQNFWRKANTEDLPDEFVGAALQLAFQLGLDNEAGDLFPRLLVIDRQNGHGILTVQTRDQFFEVFDDINRWNSNISESYYSGLLPIHYYAEHLHLSFLDLFHREFEEKQKLGTFLSSRPLYIRYGGNSPLDGFPEPLPNLRLYLDISALLLAIELQIIDEVEETFAPLYIPSEVFGALTHMMAQSYHHQPSAIEANKAILQLVAARKLKTITPEQGSTEIEVEDEGISKLDNDWINCFKTAKARNGFYLTFLPPSKLGEKYIAESVTIAPNNSKYCLDCRTLADTLKSLNELTVDEYDKIIGALGTYATVYPDLRTPQRRDFILCDDAIIDTLANAGLLEPACIVFDIHITQKTWGDAQIVAAYEDARNQDRKWLSDVQTKLRDDIAKKRIIVLPQRERDKNDDDAPVRPIADVMLAILSRSGDFQPHDLVWIDDRYTSHFRNAEKASIVGVVEIIKLLVATKKISEDRYYEILIRLRAANARFLPIQPDELIYHLKNALETNGGQYLIKDTRPLLVIEKYLACCMTDRKHFQLPPIPEQITNQQGEISFMLGVHHAIQLTLQDIWVTFHTPEARFVLGEWIVEHLYLDYPSLIMKEREQRPNDGADYYRAGAQLASFLALTFIHLRAISEEKTLYQEYIEWVFNRIIGRRLHNEPPLLEVSTQLIKRTVLEVKANRSEEIPETVIDFVFYQYISTLPQILRTKLENDEEFLTQIGVHTTPIVPIDDMEFERTEFWEAAAAAVNGGSRNTIDHVSQKEVTVSHDEEHPKTVVNIRHPLKDKPIRLYQREFPILIVSPSEQELFLRSQRGVFDYADNEFNRIVVELTSIPEPAQRILRLIEYWRASATIKYQEILQSIQMGGQLDLQQLMDISLDSLERFMRIDSKLAADSETSPFDQSAIQLIDEAGFDVAFHRLSGLPCPLPRLLIEYLESISVSDRSQILLSRVRSQRTPIGSIHLLKLLNNFRTDAAELADAADELAAELCNVNSKQEFEIFVALLVWVNEHLLLQTRFVDYPPLVKVALTWAHTHQLYFILKRSNIDPNWLHQLFSKHARDVSIDMLFPQISYWNDVAHPHQTIFERLLLTGFLYAIDRDFEIVDARSAEFIKDIMFPNVQGEIRLAASFLYLNTSFLNNSSHSFLGSNIGVEFAPLFGVEQAEFSNERFTKLIEDAILNLQTIDDSDVNRKRISWSVLSSIIRDIKLPAELADRLRQLLNGINWDELFTQDYELWKVAFICMIRQLPSLGDAQLRLKVRDVLPLIAEKGARLASLSEEQAIEISVLLMEGALRSTTDALTDTFAFDAFGTSVVNTAVRWRRFAEVCKRLVTKMSEDLPLRYAQQLWSTVVKLRTL